METKDSPNDLFLLGSVFSNVEKTNIKACQGNVRTVRRDMFVPGKYTYFIPRIVQCEWAQSS